eukprot:COSAG06_NODE_2928_length_6080_cov_4.853369_3_plen_215_part_00
MPVISSIPAPFRAAQGSAPENASHLQGTLFEEVARFLRQLASHFHVLPQLASLVRIQLLRMPVHVARSLEARHLVQAVHHVALRWLRELPRLVRRHSGPLCAAVSANAGSLTLTGHVPLACAYIGRAPLLRTRARSVSRSRGRPRARRPTALAAVPGSPTMEALAQWPTLGPCFRSAASRCHRAHTRHCLLACSCSSGRKDCVLLPPESAWNQE